MTRRASRPAPSLRAAVLDCLVPCDGVDPVADLRRLLELTRDPALELWNAYRGGRSSGWSRRLAVSTD